MLVAGLFAIAYLVIQPPSADLAAQVFRSDLFASHGFLIWNNDWYGGHYLPSYSVLFPPLAAALGPRVVGALASVAAAGLFGVVARRRYGERARLGILWFGAGTATMLFTGRLTFALGVAVGLGALFALQRDRWPLAAALGVLTALASPVAGVFLALAGVAVTVTGDRRGGAAIVAAPLAAIAALSAAFPTGGEEPFVFSSFIGVPLFAAAALTLLSQDQRTLRWGIAIYALATTLAFLVPNPIGGNMARLGSLAGGPVLALGLAGKRPLALALVALPLVAWQWVPTIRDVSDASGDSSVHRAYYEPLIGELDRLTGGRPVRIEIPPTRNRWEADYVAPRFPLARGWLRQLESGDFETFQHGNLTPAGYRTWLDDRGVSYVAVSDASPDYLARDEEALIRGDLPYLRPLWSNEHWRLYRVLGSPGLVSRATDPSAPAGEHARLTEVAPAGFSVSASTPGRYLVRIHHTSYWTITSGDGCVEGRGDWTEVDLPRPGSLDVAARFSLPGLFGRDRECSG